MTGSLAVEDVNTPESAEREIGSDRRSGEIRRGGYGMHRSSMCLIFQVFRLDINILRHPSEGLDDVKC